MYIKKPKIPLWKILAHAHFHLLISAFIYGTSPSASIVIFSTLFLFIQNNSLEQSNKLALLNKIPNGFSSKHIHLMSEGQRKLFISKSF